MSETTDTGNWADANDWKEAAVRGRWDLVDAHSVFKNHPDEFELLHQVLLSIVPTIPEAHVGEGPLSGSVRARISDGTPVKHTGSFLDRHVQLNVHANAMLRIAQQLGRPSLWVLPEDPTVEVLRLKHAMSELEMAENIITNHGWDDKKTNSGLDPDDRWLAEAEAIALQAFEAEAIVYKGLDETFVAFDRETRRLIEVEEDHGTPGTTIWCLRDLSDGPAELSGSTLWLAARALLDLEELRKIIGLPARLPPSLAEEQVSRSGNAKAVADLVTENMTDQAHLVGPVALSLGATLALLHAKKTENLVKEIKAKKVGQSLGGATRSQMYEGDRRHIVTEMQKLINDRKNISAAANLLFRQGSGTSAEANLKMYSRYKAKYLGLKD